MALAKKFPTDIIESRDFYNFTGYYEHSLKIKKKKYVSSTTQNFGQLFCKWTHSALNTIPSQCNHIPRTTNATKVQTHVPHHLLFGLAIIHFIR